MGPYILDLVLGILFILSVLISIIGFLVYRYRREIGPLILMLSGLPGAVGSFIGVLSRSNTIEVSDVIPISLLLLSFILLILSFVLWRSRK
jgi:hypothetical protein